MNPAFTGFVKIGKTTHDPEVRARQLSSGSGVPAPYAVAWDAFVSDCDQVEKLIHQELTNTRSRRDREFFATPLKNAIAVATSVAGPFFCEPEIPTETYSQPDAAIPVSPTELPTDCTLETPPRRGNIVLLASAESGAGKIDALLMRPEGATLEEMRQCRGAVGSHLNSLKKAGFNIIRENGRYYYKAEGPTPAAEIKTASAKAIGTHHEELIEVAEDCPVDRAEAPPDGNPKTIARIGYEILVDNPYMFTEREFYHELHVVRRNRSGLKIDGYNIRRSPVVKVHGWGIHRDKNGRLALVAMESQRYKELQSAVKTRKAYRTSKIEDLGTRRRKTIQEHLKACSPEISGLFQKFSGMVKGIHPEIQENSWSYGVAYRAQQNFVEVYFRTNRLEICLRPTQYHDPKGLLSGVPESYKWTLNRRFILEAEDQLPDLISLVRQSWQDVK